MVSNPPYSQNWDPDGKETDPRFSSYGIAPKSKADYAFLLHCLFHLKPDGVMTIILPHGVLFRGDQEGVIRRNLVEHRNIEAIIGLPANIFYGTGIPTIIMVLRKPQTGDDGSILIVDASKGFEKDGKNNKLRSSDIKRVVDVVRARKDAEKFARVVSIDEVRANDYNLNIPRYVDSSEIRRHGTSMPRCSAACLLPSSTSFMPTGKFCQVCASVCSTRTAEPQRLRWTT